MSDSIYKKFCCYCGREILSKEDVVLSEKKNIIPATDKYLCQDCCLSASIYLENIFNDTTLKATNQQKLTNILKSKSVQEKDTIISSCTNAIIAENDITKPKIFLNKTKKEVFEAVTQKVRYQDKAVKRIIRAIYSNLCIEDSSFKDNILLIGDTGVGKTFTITNILKEWSIPFIIADCNDFSEVGYIGKDISSTVEALYKACGKNAELASRSVIILDEFDKLRTGEVLTRDVSGESVQEELLTLLTGKKVEVSSNTFVDTSFITFILLGAFDSNVTNNKLTEIRKKRIEKSKGNYSIGFSTIGNSINEPLIESYIAEDLTTYGITAQISGRCTYIIEFNNFNNEMCKDIILNSQSSKLNHIYTKFKMLGVNLVLDDNLIDNISEYIVKLGFGARGILQYLNELFSPALEKIEDDFDEYGIEYETCIITNKTISNHEEFCLIKKV